MVEDEIHISQEFCQTLGHHENVRNHTPDSYPEPKIIAQDLKGKELMNFDDSESKSFKIKFSNPCDFTCNSSEEIKVEMPKLHQFFPSQKASQTKLSATNSGLSNAHHHCSTTGTRSH